MLLTRFRTRRLRFAMITVSHTPGNRATVARRVVTGLCPVHLYSQ